MSIPDTYSHYIIPKLNGLDSLTLVTGQQTPKPGKGEVLVAVKAVSLNYRDIAVGRIKGPDWDKAVLKITDEGAEHILEVGGPGTVEKSFSAIRRGGVITDIGFIGTKEGQNPPNISRLALFKARVFTGNSAIFRGILIGNRRQLEQMCNAISISKLKPIISKVVEFKDARSAYEAQEQQTIVGKVVIRVSQ